MKKIFLGVAFLSAYVLGHTQTVDEIANKHVEAIGGKANMEKVQNVVMEGSMDVQGATVNVTVTRVQKKLIRQDISVMGMTGYDFTTDKEGWTYMPFAGQTTPVQKTGDELKAAQEDLDISDYIYNYQAKGNKLELQGKEDVSGTDCYKIKVVSTSGKESVCYIDPTTFYLVRITETRKLNGQDYPVTVDLSDYKDVEGVKMPFTMGTMQGNIVFSSIKANQTIDQKKYMHN